MSRGQGYWYLRRYRDVLKSCGGKRKNWKCARNHWRKYGIKERRDKMAYRNLNSRQARAYIARYSDVTWKNKKQSIQSFATQHYREWGLFEERNRFEIGFRITKQQSICFLQQNVNMVQRYRRRWWSARTYFYKRGWKNSRMRDSYVCENTKTQLNLSKGPYFVADHYKRFRCNGWGTFARLSASQTGGTYKAKKPKADSFKEVSNFGFRTKAFSPKLRYKCHGSTWGKDVAPNYRKQCFCEAKPRKAPIACAKEGQWCRSC